MLGKLIAKKLKLKNILYFLNLNYTETFTLEESAKAIKTLEDRKVLGKVVVSME